VFDRLTELLCGSPVAYPVIAAAVCVDAFLPVVPGETVVITGAILAADGDLLVWVVLAAAPAGALRGRRHLLRARSGRRRAGRAAPVPGRALAAPARLGAGPAHGAWTRADHGRRFIPGGRTAVTFSAGMLHMPWRRFLVADAIGCGLWVLWQPALASSAARLSGTASGSRWSPVAVAGLVAGIGELWRRLTESRSKRASAAR
jgi:membrane-associated protein